MLVCSAWLSAKEELWASGEGRGAEREPVDEAMLMGRRQSGVLAREGGAESDSRTRFALSVVRNAAHTDNCVNCDKTGVFLWEKKQSSVDYFTQSRASLTSRSLETRYPITDCKGSVPTGFLKQSRWGRIIDSRLDRKEGRS